MWTHTCGCSGVMTTYKPALRGQCWHAQRSCPTLMLCCSGLHNASHAPYFNKETALHHRQTPICSSLVTTQLYSPFPFSRNTQDIFLKLNVAEAQATVESDRIKILNDIKASTGIEAMNQSIRKALVRAYWKWQGKGRGGRYRNRA